MQFIVADLKQDTTHQSNESKEAPSAAAVLEEELFGLLQTSKRYSANMLSASELVLGKEIGEAYDIFDFGLCFNPIFLLNLVRIHHALG